MAVRENMSGVEQRGILQSAHGTLVPIGGQHLDSKNRLVQPLPGEALNVASLGLADFVANCHEPLRYVEGNDKLKSLGLVSNDPDWIDWNIGADCCSHEPYKWKLVAKCLPQCYVFRVVAFRTKGVQTPVLVAKQAIRPLGVLVRRSLPGRCESGADRQRGCQVGWFTDPSLRIQ